jgi:hypothetical protein
MYLGATPIVLIAARSRQALSRFRSCLNLKLGTKGQDLQVVEMEQVFDLSDFVAIQ